MHIYCHCNPLAQKVNYFKCFPLLLEELLYISQLHENLIQSVVGVQLVN